MASVLDSTASLTSAEPGVYSIPKVIPLPSFAKLGFSKPYSANNEGIITVLSTSAVLVDVSAVPSLSASVPLASIDTTPALAPIPNEPAFATEKLNKLARIIFIDCDNYRHWFAHKIFSFIVKSFTEFHNINSSLS